MAITCSLKLEPLKRKKFDAKDMSSHVPLEIGIRSVLSFLVHCYWRTTDRHLNNELFELFNQNMRCLAILTVRKQSVLEGLKIHWTAETMKMSCVLIFQKQCLCMNMLSPHSQSLPFSLSNSLLEKKIN